MYDTDKVEYKQTIPSDYKLVLKYKEQVRSRYEGEVSFVCGYEAGCLGYSLYHQLKDHAVDCKILAPSTMAITNTHHVKTDKRDAANIARCLAFHTYSEVYVPDSDDNDVNLAFVLRQGKRYDRKAARNRLNVSDDDTIVIAFVGALSERKRPMDLIRAVEKLQNQGMDIVTLLIGKGDKRDEIEEYICTHHIKDVQMCGFVKQEKLSEYLVATDLYVLPSLNDASPKALNEAMNFSLPIIVSDGVETANEMLNEGENGYLFRAGDVANGSY